jgi:ribonuclease HII
VGIVIGIDEAGLGPNLGPFVVTAVAWETPGSAAECDLSGALSGAMSGDLACDDGRMVVADSKRLFQPHRSLHVPERSVLSLLHSWRERPATLTALDDWLQPQRTESLPPLWLMGRDLPLPLDADPAAILPAADRLRAAAVRVRHIESRILQPAEFNRRLQSGNKAAVTSGAHLDVLRATCRACGDADIVVFSDKHGGRNAYGAMLSAQWEGAWVDVLQEGPLLSAYRVAGVELRFEPRAERHLPVAMASMISKYVREAHMRLFNQFWQEHCPELRPTQGYPEDARRFIAEIAECRERLEIALDDLWRKK